MLVNYSRYTSIPGIHETKILKIETRTAEEPTAGSCKKLAPPGIPVIPGFPGFPVFHTLLYTAVHGCCVNSKTASFSLFDFFCFECFPFFFKLYYR